MRQNHPVLQQPWDLDTFCTQTFVLGSFYGGSFAGAVDDALAELGKSRNVALSVQNFSLIPDILRQSDWLAVVPAHLIRADDNLAVRPLPLEVQGYDKVMVWHERTHFDNVHRWLRDQITETVKGIEKAV